MQAEPRTHSLQTSASAECLQRVHVLLGELWAASPDVCAQDRIGFETAVAEVAANIVEHAAAGCAITMVLDVCAYPDRIEARFRDTGCVAPAHVLDTRMPGCDAEDGRGIALARASVDDLAYERDGAVNRWRVVRRRR